VVRMTEKDLKKGITKRPKKRQKKNSKMVEIE
jgi:hypothetical protein